MRGYRCRVVGAVSMDFAHILLPDDLSIGVGEIVTLIGRDGKEEVTVEELAELFGTHAYEILCLIPTRIQEICVISFQLMNYPMTLPVRRNLVSAINTGVATEGAMLDARNIVVQGLARVAIDRHSEIHLRDGIFSVVVIVFLE